MSHDRAFFEAVLLRIGIIAVTLAALTSLLQYAAASRGSGNWERLDDPVAWVWTAVGAFFVGFWGYSSILISALSPKPLGRTMFMVLGFLYLGFAALVGREIYSSGGDLGMLFDVVVVPVVSAVVMLPLFLIVSFIGRKAG